MHLVVENQKTTLFLGVRNLNLNLSPRTIHSSGHFEPASEAIDESLFIFEECLECTGVEGLSVTWVNTNKAVFWLKDEVVCWARSILSWKAFVNAVTVNTGRNEAPNFIRVLLDGSSFPDNFLLKLPSLIKAFETGFVVINGTNH